MATKSFYGWQCISDDHVYMTATERKALKIMLENGVKECHTKTQFYEMEIATAADFINYHKTRINEISEVRENPEKYAHTEKAMLTLDIMTKCNILRNRERIELLSQYAGIEVMSFEGNYFIRK